MMALDAAARHDLDGRPAAEFSVDMRYQGQGHELNVPWDGRSTADLLAAFHHQHQQRYGHSDASRTLELITLRLRARVRRDILPLPGIEAGGEDPGPAHHGTRRVELANTTEVPLYNRGALRAGNVVSGPAIVEQLDSTTLVLDDWYASVDPSGTLVLMRQTNAG
jgi:N-methylhydantoinase A